MNKSMADCSHFERDILEWDITEEVLAVLLKDHTTGQNLIWTTDDCQKRDWQLELLDNHSAFGRSRVALGMFKTEQEAENFFKFCQPYLVRFLFLMTDEALTTLAKEVPYFADWKKAGGLIDFSGDINAQLCTLAKLTKTEAAYVEEKVRAFDNSRHRKG